MSVKAFDLVPALEKVELMGEKSKTVIECLECCGKNLYIGTNDCFVVHYMIEEKTQANGKVSFKTEKISHKYLSMRKPIVSLKSASAINKIFVLCDNNLIFLSMFNLEVIQGQGKMKNIIAFCFNENPHNNNPFCVQMGVAKKKQIQLFNVTEDKVIHLKDVSTNEPPLALAMDGNFMCVAMSTQYNMIDIETGHKQELFPLDSDLTSPVVKRISKEEFLLNGPSSLGVFVTSAGVSQRPPIQWNESVYAVAYSHPYVLSLSNDFITVHSILDQQSKQIMSFKGGCRLENFDGRLYVASRTIVYGLVPIPWEKQVQALLGDKRIDEAIELAKYANKAGLSKEQFDKIFQRINIQAGFIEFAQLEFSRAKEFFKSGNADIREIICLYPNLLPSNTQFTRAFPPFHDLADVMQLCKDHLEMLTQYKLFIVSFLEEEKNSYSFHPFLQEIDVALLKLYAEMNSPDLIHLIETSISYFSSDDCILVLEEFNCHHALAILNSKLSSPDRSLQIWSRLLNGEISDKSFPGRDFFIDFLIKLDVKDLVWKYSELILVKDQVLGSKIFTMRDYDSNYEIKLEDVVEYLHRYQEAIVLLLEHVVYTLKVEKEKFHTHLAVLYFENVLKIKNCKEVCGDTLREARSKLQHLLQESSTYRTQLLLAKVIDAKLHEETAILYGKLEEHEKALKILVYELRDYKYAEKYCMLNSKGSPRSKKYRLFHILLNLYMNPNQSDCDIREDLHVPALSLLNNEEAEFDTVKVLKMIPDYWGIAVVNRFLKKAVRLSLHRSRMTRTEKALARCEDLQVKFTRLEINRNVIAMSEDELCGVCSKPFANSQFTRYPNGVVTHIKCAKNKITCVKTGKLFTNNNPFEGS